MTDLKAQLRELVPEFTDPADDELEPIAAAGEVRELAVGDTFGQAGQTVEGGFFVLDGALEAWVHVPSSAARSAFVRLARERIVTPEEAYSKAVDNQEVLSKLNVAGFRLG
jgi:hypothetical protein